MSGTSEQFEGGCLCGAVRFIATGEPKGIYWCHCQSCRRHTGAPVSVFVAFDCEAYTVTKGEITKFDSTPGKTRRGFCARCGSTLTCESLPGPTETHFHVGAFDQHARLQPRKQSFPEEGEYMGYHKAARDWARCGAKKRRANTSRKPVSVPLKRINWRTTFRTTGMRSGSDGPLCFTSRLNIGL